MHEHPDDETDEAEDVDAHAAAGGLAYCLGNVLFLRGYADVKLDVSMARYQKGGALKPLGYMIALGTCSSALYSMAMLRK